jgi:hypothetical protein
MPNARENALMIAVERRVSGIITDIYDIGCEGGGGKPDSNHKKICSYTKPGHSEAKCFSRVPWDIPVVMVI